MAMKKNSYLEKWIEFNTNSPFIKTPLHSAVYYHLVLLSEHNNNAIIIDIHELSKQICHNDIFEVLNCIFDLKQWMLISTSLLDKRSYKLIKISLL